MYRWILKWKKSLVLAFLAAIMLYAAYGAAVENGWFDCHLDTALRYLGDRHSAIAAFGGLGICFGMASFFFWPDDMVLPEDGAKPAHFHQPRARVRWQ